MTIRLWLSQALNLTHLSFSPRKALINIKFLLSHQWARQELTPNRNQLQKDFLKLRKNLNPEHCHFVNTLAGVRQGCRAAYILSWKIHLYFAHAITTWVSYLSGIPITEPMFMNISWESWSCVCVYRFH